MKFKLIILSVLLSPLFLFSQSKSSLDIVGGADYAYRTLSSSIDTSFILDGRNAQEKGRIKARFGFNYNRKIKDRLFFKTGLRFASVGYLVTDVKGLIFGSDLDILEGSNGSSTSMIEDRSLKLIEDNYFIEVPLALRYEFPKNKVSFFIEAGLSPNIYLATRVKQILDGEVTTAIVDSAIFNYSRMHIVGSLSLGLNFNLNDNWQLFAQPIGRYHFTNLISAAEVQENLYTLGLELGVRRFLK